MLFQDQAQQLVTRWELLKSDDDIETLAAQTAIALAIVPEVPESVMRALDHLLSYKSGHRAMWMVEVVRYLRTLATAKLRIPLEER